MRISDWSSDVCSSDLGKAAGEVLQPVGAARDEQEVIAFGRKPFGIGYTDARRGARDHGDICLAHYCPSIRHAQRAACLASPVRREWIDYIHNPYPATKFLKAQIGNASCREKGGQCV